MPKNRILISSIDSAIGLIERYAEFDGSVMKVCITNCQNRSNFKSITKNEVRGGVSFAKSRLDIGDTYVTYFRYDQGKVVLERRFNRLNKSLHVRETVVSNNCGEIFLTDYNGKKTISFTIHNITSNGRVK